MVKKGFTLLELLIVTVIIGILASVAIVRYPKVVKKAKIAEAYTILGAMRRSEVRYEAEYGSYAADTTKLDVTVPSSIYFDYTADVEAGTLTATGKGTMDGVSVTLTIGGTTSVNGL